MRALFLVLIACGDAAPHIVTPPVSANATPVGSASAGDCAPYRPMPAWSGQMSNLPMPPTLPIVPQVIGDAFTVFGAHHRLHNKFEQAELQKDVAIIGYIVDTNLTRAPPCAVHHTGVADPKGCMTEIPTFSISDAKGDTQGLHIRVMGWASNFANVYEASLLYAKQKPATLYKDVLWSSDVPYPLPAVGARVKVVGRYSFIFAKSSSGIVADPDEGIMTVGRIDLLEPAPAPTKFP